MTVIQNRIVQRVAVGLAGAALAGGAVLTAAEMGGQHGPPPPTDLKSSSVVSTTTSPAPLSGSITIKAPATTPAKGTTQVKTSATTKSSPASKKPAPPSKKPAPKPALTNVITNPGVTPVIRSEAKGVSAMQYPGLSTTTCVNLSVPGNSVHVTGWDQRRTDAVDVDPGNPTVMNRTNGGFFDFPGWTHTLGAWESGGKLPPAGASNVSGEARPVWEFSKGNAKVVNSNGHWTPPPGVTDAVEAHDELWSNGKSNAPFDYNHDGPLLNYDTPRTLFSASEDGQVFCQTVTHATTGAEGAQLAVDGAHALGEPAQVVVTEEDGGGSAEDRSKAFGVTQDENRKVENSVEIRAAG